MSGRARSARALTVALVLFLPAAVLAPRALFLGWRLSDAAMLTDPAAADRGAPSPGAEVAAIRHDPYLALADDTLRQGRLPVWNRFHGFGEPLLGHAAVGAFHPLDPLRWVLPHEASRAWRVALFLMVAGWCTYRLLRGLGATRGAALVGAMAYEMNGFALAWIHFPHLRVAVLLPLVVWAADRLLRQPDARRAAGLALAVALVFLADHPETATPVLLLALLHCGLRGLLCARTLGGARRLGRAALWLLIGAGLGTAAGWIQIGLTVADGSWPGRAVASSRHLLAFLVPETLLAGSGVEARAHGAAYFGVLPLLAALAAVLAGVWRDPRVRVFAALGALSLLGAGAWPAAFFERLAELTGVRSDRMVLGVALAGSVLAGLGVDGCRPRADGRRAPAAPLGLATALLGIGLATVLANVAARHPERAIAALWNVGLLPDALWRTGLAAVLAAAAFALLLRLRTAPRPGPILAGILVLTAGDLWLHGHGHARELPPGADPFPRAVVEGLPPTARAAAANSVLPPATNLALGLRDVRGMRSEDLPDMRALLDRLLPADPAAESAPAGPGLALVRLGVDTWLSAAPRDAAQAPSGSAGEPNPIARFAPPERCGDLLRWRAPDAGPDAALCSGYRIVESLESFLRELAAPGADPLERPGLPYAPIHWSEARDAPAGTAARTALPRIDTAPGRFAVALPERQASAVLVVREAFHPGWRAVRESGEPLELERADMAFLGAVLPPGAAETIAFVFEPPALRSGRLVSLIAAALIGLLLIARLLPLPRRARVELAPAPIAAGPPGGDGVEPGPSEPGPEAAAGPERSPRPQPGEEPPRFEPDGEAPHA